MSSANSNEDPGSTTSTGGAAAAAAENSNKQYVTDLHPHDVLFGRGSGPNDHEGNIRFRQYVAERKASYMATNHRATKTNIAREIVNLVEQNGGRFLKKLEVALEDGAPDMYEVVDDDNIMEKAKQALRQNAAKVRGEQQLQAAKQNQQASASVASGGSSGTPTGSLGGYSQYSQQHHLHQQPTYEVDLEPLPFSGNFNQPQQPQIDPIPVQSYDHIVPQKLQQQPQQHSVGPTSLWEGPDLHPSMATSMQPPVQYSYEQHPPLHHHHQQQQQHQPGTGLDRYAAAEPSANIGRNNMGPSKNNQESAPAGAAGAANNYSMAEVPPAQDQYGSESRRISLSIDDIFKFKEARKQNSTGQPGAHLGTSMDDLTDSFSQMKTSGNQGAGRMMMSADTMGTIEGIPAGGVADMSLGTLDSSTFSLFGKGNDSMNMGGWSGEGSSGSGSNKPSFLDVPSSSAKVPHVNPDPSLASSGLTGSSSIRTPSSKSVMEASSATLFSESHRSAGSISINGAIDAVRRQVESEYPSIGTLPRAVDEIQENPDNLEERMGDSSLSLLKKVLPEEGGGAAESSAATLQEHAPPYHHPGFHPKGDNA